MAYKRAVAPSDVEQPIVDPWRTGRLGGQWVIERPLDESGAPGAAGARLQIEHQGQGIADSLHLVESEEADGFWETSQVNSRELIAHDQRRLIGDLHDWSKGGFAGAGTG